ncbi:AFG1-like ATPase-domain-containing protein [Clohesyomyces aquaticus]|uniref:AFG1-like ATPase-domain-containing protein n=1 Tax=Clohesyomyces aquaticus TaxID=1231657 RepID=A0A1Y1ZFC9_9PLEO|nr:AFG1-like ATPase-domain-containing protein [Clohesyomyces aquaticus]
MPPNGTSLAITNPLVLYRSLVATNRIKADPAQHRLALHLQTLYEYLKDYDPAVEYSDRLQQLTRAVNVDQEVSPLGQPFPGSKIIGRRGIWRSLIQQREQRESLALTRVLTSHEAAMSLTSPKGLMLHGEVGTGKSMLIDLFVDCLPHRKKKRWHFNTFMLDTFSRLESLRKSRAIAGSLQDEFSLMWLARDLIQTSPILFLDEFQLPDRVASKILSNLMTRFFQLGGVLVATSNRMPEELAKAAGMEFSRPIPRLSRMGWTLGLGGVVGRDAGPGQLGEFAQFLELLRSRCDVWEMEGKSDYRRMAGEEDEVKSTVTQAFVPETAPQHPKGRSQGSSPPPVQEGGSKTVASHPKHYLLIPPSSVGESILSSFKSSLSTAVRHAILEPSESTDVEWSPSTLTVYGRIIVIPHRNNGTAMFTFDELCGAALGPADYITIASTFHTIILTDVPVMGFLQKNEARRLITLLDAMYEAKCRLLITAPASPDEIFFPEIKPVVFYSSTDTNVGEDVLTSDATYAETYSEIHQDLASPFRPNVSSYSPSLSADALEDDPPNRLRRPGSSFTDERILRPGNAKSPNFTNLRGLTGEDELFAVKRAQSRIWEMCSAKWWEREGSSGEGEEVGQSWWRPLPLESRHWERSSSSSIPASPARSDVGPTPQATDARTPESLDDLFAHEASPFRTVTDAPPKFNWTHAWGTIRWGKKSGAWGKGVEGLEERRKDRPGMESDRDGASGDRK